MTARKECDLIMKGGITSGVVYPRAVLELHQNYDFRSIGGASAGAIAAAATAAAQFGGDPGFERLARLDEELARPGVLRGLFQPSISTRPLLDFFLLALEAVHDKESSRFGKALSVLVSLLRCGLAGALSAAALGLIIAVAAALAVGGRLWSAPILVAVVALLAAIAGAAAQLLWIALREVTKSGLGMCSGMPEPEYVGQKALTPWLFEQMNLLANRTAGDAPVTFGDLDDAGIELKLMTTNLSDRAPYTVPFTTHRFLFSEGEFRDLFPSEAVDFLIAQAHQSARTRPPPGFYYLPDWRLLPIALGARLSLSFPVLIRPIPLYTVKVSAFHGPEPVQLAAEDLLLNHFSDGGICSNFPIHFFDELVPSRPTFGITLGEMPAAETSNTARPLEGMGRADVAANTPDVYLPRANEVSPLGWKPVRTVAGLLGAMFDTAMSYRDVLQSHMPGFRERIVEVRLTADEGGLNLDMNTQRIAALAKKGTMAGQLLLSQFDMDVHRWVRLQALMPPLAEVLAGLQAVVATQGTSSDAWYRPNMPYKRDGQWHAAATECLAHLNDAGTPAGLAELQRPDPKPQGKLRVTPKE